MDGVLHTSIHANKNKIEHAKIHSPQRGYLGSSQGFVRSIVAIEIDTQPPLEFRVKMLVRCLGLVCARLPVSR